ncbi:hypothetical protein KAS50_05725, partial [bacterium]|nr:hypothetical protein [bacterium]
MKKPVLLSVIFIFLVFFTASLYAETGATTIAKWKDNKSGAFSMGFDDALASHVDYCIPAFVKRGLTGSFWVNPATARYGYGIDTWEGSLGQNVIELCPHSMNHSGSLFMEQAIYEVEECLDIVWSLNPPGQSKLVLFLGGGGAVYPQGFRDVMRSKFPTLLSGRGGGGRYRRDGLISFAKDAIDRGIWNSIATHGAGPYAEYLSFDASEFEALLDYLASVKDKLWVGTCGDVHKYNKERASARVSVIEAKKDRVRL